MRFGIVWCADCGEFKKDKGIGARANDFVEAAAVQNFIEAAWNQRNCRGVSWAQWWRRTPDDYVTS